MALWFLAEPPAGVTRLKHVDRMVLHQMTHNIKHANVLEPKQNATRNMYSWASAGGKHATSLGALRSRVGKMYATAKKWCAHFSWRHTKRAAERALRKTDTHLERVKPQMTSHQIACIVIYCYLRIRCRQWVQHRFQIHGTARVTPVACIK